MKITKYEGGDIQRLVLTGMIVKQHVLATIADKWKEPGLFPDPWSNIIGQWCVDYYNKYEKAPKKDIQTIFEKWSQKFKDKDTIGIVGSFLGKLSKQYESTRKQMNAAYVLDQAKDLFVKSQIIELQERLGELVELNDLKKAEAAIENFSKVEMTKDAYVDVFSASAKEKFRNAMNQKDNSVLKYDGAIGNFLGNRLEREGFISFMGPEKVGKTWWLLEIAMKGVLEGKKVAFFEVGDMSEAQILRRFAVRVARRPLEPSEVKIPVGIMPNEPIADVELKVKTYDKYLSMNKAWKGVEKMIAKGKSDLLRLNTYPNDSISADGIKAVLDKQVRKGWCPDIVVIDYADILAPGKGYEGDSRDAINSTWKRLRSLSQFYHCLVVTATQSNAASYDTKVLTKKNFSNDKRKFAHITGMIGLNCVEQEKDIGVMRLNWLDLREGSFSRSKCVHVAGSFGIARPVMFSTF